MLVNTNWPNGRSGFYFTSDGTALTFSGLGNEQVKPHPDQAVQPIDLVIISQAVRPTDTVVTSSVRLKAVGQCEFSNPVHRQSLFSCRAVTENGVFEAAFVTDGKPPQPLDLGQERHLPPDQLIYNDHTLQHHEARSAALPPRPTPLPRAGPASGVPTPHTPPRPNVPVAQRAILYEENAAEPQSPKASAGRAVWRVDALNTGQGQPVEMAVRANVEIPGVGLGLALSLRRNADPALPASHIIELNFTYARRARPRRA